MAISSNTTGLRPGVCTSTSRPSSPYEGQMIYETDTNRVLVWDNAAWVMIAATDSPPGLELVKTQTVGAGVASVIVTGAFSSTYDNYKIQYSGGTSSANSVDIAMRLRVAGTSSITGYYSAMIYAAGGAPTSFNVVNGMDWLNAGGCTEFAPKMNLELLGPNLAQFTSMSGPSPRSDINGTIMGHHRVSTAYDSFEIFPTAGTITGGVIRIYGYRK